jgi:hypothetical protein
MKYSLIIFLLIAFPANAKTWLVGPTRQYTAPSKVMPLVADGDTVLIDSGLYTGDVGTWTNNNLVIRCPNGMARFNANGNIADLKGIWVVYGQNTYVEGFEFYGAAIDSADGDNGAGIRVQGDGFTCRRCYFHDNQEGILTGNDTTNNNILIESCEFDHNGVETGGAAGFEHNIYIGLCSVCTIKFCYFHASIVGHEVKCRANKSYILYNYIVDGPTGDGSLSIDIPQGGLAFVIGNSIEKGPMTENSTVIAYGEEGFKNPDTAFYFVNNTIVTDRNPTTFFEIAAGTKTAIIANNIIAGTGHPITGFTDTMANVIETDTSFFHFADPSNYDYTLTENFPGVTSAVNLGTVDGFSLTPVNEYVDPMDSASRQFLNEVGAFSKIFSDSISDSIMIINSFPEVVCFGEVDTEKIAVTNTGTNSTSYMASIGGTLADFRIISSNPSPVIQPGRVDTFIITFSPGDIGTSFATFNVVGGAGGSIPITANVGSSAISGNGTAPPTLAGTSENFIATICNSGTCPFTPGIPVVTPPFAYVSGASISIPPGGCDTLVFSFDPSSSGTFTQMVQFPSIVGFTVPAASITITGIATSSGVNENGISNAHTVEQNYPNPFSSETVIPLPLNTFGSLELFDVCGNLMDVKYEQVENGLIVERGNLPDGIYFYRINVHERGTIAEGSFVIGN